MTSQELVQQQGEAVAFVDGQLRTEIRELLPATLTEAQFIRALKNALISDPTGNLLKADRVSLYHVGTRCAMEGMLPDGREAVILPYWDNKNKTFRAQYIRMIGGDRKLCGEYGWALIAHVVYENDEFDPDLENHRANHKPTRLGHERGEIRGAYALAEHRDGRKIGPTVMDLKDIGRVRAKSKQPDGQLWTEWFDRACEKTVAKQVMKQIPWDSKDRERINLLLSDDTNGDDAIEVLYGTQDRPMDLPPIQADEGPGESAAALSPDHPASPADEAEFNGEEPDDAPVVIEAEVIEEATFTSGKHEGKTVAEVWELGEDGQRYVRWAKKNWKTGPIVAALEAFVEPEVEQ